MTRREMLKECRDSAVRNLPRLLGSAAGLWTGVEKLLEEQIPPAEVESAACFPAAPAATAKTRTSDNAGE